ncbi:hypothetical protein O6P43_023621 [Quillaja saponaria]|uniref:Uncharacterized protein n=1 Tax=Quillaja saponaria TaxID=32244 RepID=A0AAD7PJM1_QUISA|nr:hypothetical protein O6P43_023621 [Quillaja saponaria]
MLPSHFPSVSPSSPHQSRNNGILIGRIQKWGDDRCVLENGRGTCPRSSPLLKCPWSSPSAFESVVRM